MFPHIFVYACGYTTQTQYVVWKTYRKGWIIGTNVEKESGKSVFTEGHCSIYIYIYIYPIDEKKQLF